MCGQPSACGSVGPPNLERNQSRTTGWAQASAVESAGDVNAVAIYQY
jgi:hypothetical protein